MAAALGRSGALHVHVRVDERVAGFTALGLARESGVPAVLVCTSGTAAAGYVPAVMEAFHSGVPLVVLTADRPPELRGVGANQATTQVDMYRPWVRLGVDAPVPGDADPVVFSALAADAVACAMGAEGNGLAGVAGPVHLNLPMREPLSGPLPDRLVATPGITLRPAPAAAVPIVPGPRTIVLAGADAGAEAADFAHDGGWPLIAEVVSGARVGDTLVPRYRARLNDPALAERIERVVVFGHPTLSRETAALLRRTDVEVVAVRRGGEALNLSGRAVDVRSVVAAGRSSDVEWLSAWIGTAHPDPGTAQEGDAPVDRRALVRAVWSASGPDDRLLFGSSRIVRVADDVLGPHRVHVHANRGLAGIDGTVSTGIGIAAASQRAGKGGVTRVLLGDLAFLHDVGALLLPADEPVPRIQVIVGNDGGGTIFDGLEVAATAGSAALDRAFYTPHSVALAGLAAAYGWDHRRVETVVALATALAADVRRPGIVEVPLPR